jgi:hypothetical protein
MAVASPRDALELDSSALSASVRHATHRDDVELVGLLTGIFVILLAAVVLLGVTPPVS